MAILPVGIGPQEGGYQIERSLRFNSADSAYLNRTAGVAPTSASIGTLSFWAKLGAMSGGADIFSSGTPELNVRMSAVTTNALTVYLANGNNGTVTFAPLFRDPSAWYHIVLKFDTQNGTAANRVVGYVNGTTMTKTTDTHISAGNLGFMNNGVISRIGTRTVSAGFYYSGYLAEIHFIDGSALDPTSFGEYNSETGVWQPKAYTGSYGTNGFYLDFADNSSTTALGYDAAGSNDWTPNNFSVTAGAGNDSLVDTPTPYGTDTGAGGEVRGNYATLNPLTPPVNGSLSNGNLLFTGATDWGGSKSTIAIPTTGKWYAEFTLGSTSSNSAQADVGIFPSGNTNYYDWTGSYGLELNNSFFLITNGSYSSARSGTTAGGTVLQIAVDADAGKVWFGVANAWYDTFNTTNGNPGAGTNPSGSSINFSTTTYFMGVKTDFNNWTANFGQRPFAYTAPSGFKALCTTNLPEPTIADGSTAFNTVLYTGDGTTSRTVSGVGFEGDAVWIKGRNSAWNNILADRVRSNSYSITNATDAEYNFSSVFAGFTSDGFTIGNSGAVNNSGDTYVAWNWKANGAGVTNTAGTITGTVTVSANTTAGFSIVTYTGTGSAATVGHGLGVAPSMVIIKDRDSGSNFWVVGTKSLGFTSDNYLRLNATSAVEAGGGVAWNNTAPTSTTVSIGNSTVLNASGNDYVMYCFAPVEGYSAFGSFVGLGATTDNTFIYTGFKPRYLMFKRSDNVGDWVMLDSARSPYNQGAAYLYANASNAEATNGYQFDFVSNGIKIRDGAGNIASGGTYIYAAFAETPFSLSLAR